MRAAITVTSSTGMTVLVGQTSVLVENQGRNVLSILAKERLVRFTQAHIVLPTTAGVATTTLKLTRVHKLEDVPFPQFLAMVLV
jgi:hypothetical protein